MAPPPPAPATPSSSPGSLVAIYPWTVSASSFMAVGAERHPPDHAFDGNPDTAWQEGGGRAGQGAWVEARLAAERRIREIQFSTGYDAVSPKYGDLFVLNRHVKRMHFVFDGRTTISREVADTEREIDMKDLNVTATTIRLVVDEVYRGDRWQDICISEVQISGDPVADLPTENVDP
jgi:hypothetical protein